MPDFTLKTVCDMTAIIVNELPLKTRQLEFWHCDLFFYQKKLFSTFKNQITGWDGFIDW